MSKSVVTSRRSFIKGAVAGAVSAGVAPVMAAPAPQNGLPAKWDGEADVVIVGFGGAGATTGIVAAQNGAKVIILEKNPQNHHYSNTRMSGWSSRSRPTASLSQLNTGVRVSSPATSAT